MFSKNLLVSLLFLLTCTLYSQDKERVYLNTNLDLREVSRKANLEIFLMELESEMSNKFQLIDREELDTIIDEFQLKKAQDSTQAIEWFKISGFDWVVEPYLLDDSLVLKAISMQDSSVSSICKIDLTADGFEENFFKSEEYDYFIENLTVKQLGMSISVSELVDYTRGGDDQEVVNKLLYYLVENLCLNNFHVLDRSHGGSIFRERKLKDLGIVFNDIKTHKTAGLLVVGDYKTYMREKLHYKAEIKIYDTSASVIGQKLFDTTNKKELFKKSAIFIKSFDGKIDGLNSADQRKKLYDNLLKLYFEGAKLSSIGVTPNKKLLRMHATAYNKDEATVQQSLQKFHYCLNLFPKYTSLNEREKELKDSVTLTTALISTSLKFRLGETDLNDELSMFQDLSSKEINVYLINSAFDGLIRIYSQFGDQEKLWKVLQKVMKFPATNEAILMDAYEYINRLGNNGRKDEKRRVRLEIFYKVLLTKLSKESSKRVGILEKIYADYASFYSLDEQLSGIPRKFFEKYIKGDEIKLSYYINIVRFHHGQNFPETLKKEFVSLLKKSAYEEREKSSLLQSYKTKMESI